MWHKHVRTPFGRQVPTVLRLTQASQEHPLPFKSPHVYRQCFLAFVIFRQLHTSKASSVFFSAPWFQPPSKADTISINWPSPLGFD